MPRDLQNNEVHVGDEVVVRCKVAAVQPNEFGLNVAVTPVNGGDNSHPWLLNTQQLEVVDSIGDTAQDIDIRGLLHTKSI